MSDKKRILFVTNVNLASNPRCHKEVKTLLSNGANVTVLKFVLNNWSALYEEEIEKNIADAKWIKISASKKPLLPWLIATAISMFSKQLLFFFNNNARLIAYYLDKRSYLIYGKLKRIEQKFDLIIAHNPGTFWAVHKYAHLKNIPYGADIEDYHPGEYNNRTNEAYMRTLIKKTLKSAAYISAASPLILEYSKKDLQDADDHSIVINNVFSLQLQPAFNELNIQKDSILKLVWFSQNIGLDRGLDDIIKALNNIKDFSIILTLIGNHNVEIAQTLNNMLSSNRHALQFLKPLSEAALIAEVANHHIGLALESSPNLNRRLCLTNKLFTYLLSGNAIIASDTEAQKGFIAQYPDVGEVYSSGDSAQLANIIADMYKQPARLQSMRHNAYNLAQKELNWEKEQIKFLSLVNKAIA